MDELKKQISSLADKIDQAITDLSLTNKEKRLQELKELMSAPDFWQDQTKAKTISSEYNNLETTINNWRNLEKNIIELKNLLADDQATGLQTDINNKLTEIEKIYQGLQTELWLQGKYDNLPAIITIQSGAGGDDAQDWSAMLERMYLRLAENNGWQVKHLSRSPGAAAGIKSSTFKITGAYAYGYLQTEAGVHRLVRLSPFDADHARHTSFAMVEILPELTKTEININPADLKIDTFRASGHGGQSVNTTDSAVRITHLPTGLIAICQNERSQLQNKNQAMAYLYSKLQKYQTAVKEEEKRALKGEYTEAAWGNQIRSYVLHPYKMVKDHRTNFEVKDPDRVLGGGLDDFINDFLHYKGQRIK